jgi:hypothetical protein
MVSALISASLRLAVASDRPIYKQNRLPCHDHANRRRFLKTLTFTEPEAIDRKIPLIFASGRYDKCVILLIFILNLYAPESYFF